MLDRFRLLSTGLLVLLLSWCAHIQAQTNDWEWLEQRPWGIAPALPQELWEQLLEQAMKNPNKAAEAKSPYNEPIEIRIEGGICYVHCGEALYYEIYQAPWSIEGERPILQITTLEAPFVTSHLAAYWHEPDNKRWQVQAPLVTRDLFLRQGLSRRSPELQPYLSLLDEIPLSVHFTPEQNKASVGLVITPILRGWQDEEVLDALARILECTPRTLRLERSGKIR